MGAQSAGALMTAASIARYQRIRARILNWQRPMYVGPLTPMQRAVLRLQYPEA
jgi:hypothetical protein